MKVLNVLLTLATTAATTHLVPSPLCVDFNVSGISGKKHFSQLPQILAWSLSLTHNCCCCCTSCCCCCLFYCGGCFWGVCCCVLLVNNLHIFPNHWISFQFSVLIARNC